MIEAETLSDQLVPKGPMPYLQQCGIGFAHFPSGKNFWDYRQNAHQNSYQKEQASKTLSPNFLPYSLKLCYKYNAHFILKNLLDKDTQSAHPRPSRFSANQFTVCLKNHRNESRPVPTVSVDDFLRFSACTIHILSFLDQSSTESRHRHIGASSG